MECIISIYDPETHSYDYLSGRVVSIEKLRTRVWFRVKYSVPPTGWPLDVLDRQFEGWAYGAEAAAKKAAANVKYYGGTITSLHLVENGWGGAKSIEDITHLAAH